MPVKSNHLIVGLTGGIAGGKSTVSGMFRDLGARLIDFDALADTGEYTSKKIIEIISP